jgi:dynein heavy chain
LFAPYRPEPEETQVSAETTAVVSQQSYPPIAVVLEPSFIFALVWSVGASVDHEGRLKFNAFLRSRMDSSHAACPPPNVGLVYDYCYDLQKGAWRGWMETVPGYVPDLSLPFSQLIVPTMDSVRYRFVLDLLMRNGKHVLCIGPTGTGKTVSIMDTLLNSMPSKYQYGVLLIYMLCDYAIYSSVVLSFSAQTSANQTQDILDARLEKRRKGVFGPPVGRKLVVFVDDLNMPKKEKYGAQPPVELLRQWMDHDGWYDRKSMQFKKVVGIFILRCSFSLLRASISLLFDTIRRTVRVRNGTTGRW